MNAVYVGGLFEGEDNPLYKTLKRELKKRKVNLTGVFPFETKIVGCSSPAQLLLDQARNFSKNTLYITHSIGSYLTLQTLKPKNCILLDPSLEPQKVFASLGFDSDKNRTNCSVIATSSFKKFVTTSPSIKQICQSCHFNHLTSIGAEKGGHRIAREYYLYAKKSSTKKMIYMRNTNHDMSLNGDYSKIVTLIKKQVDSLSPAFPSNSNLHQQKVRKRLSDRQTGKFFNPEPVTL